MVRCTSSMMSPLSEAKLSRLAMILAWEVRPNSEGGLSWPLRRSCVFGGDGIGEAVLVDGELRMLSVSRNIQEYLERSECLRWLRVCLAGRGEEGSEVRVTRRT
jgi:hypothetical protein